MMKKILLIGCGHMGSALLASWIKSKKYSISIVDPLKYNSLKNKFKNNRIKIFKKILDLKINSNFDFIILATRPLDLNDALVDLSKIKLNSKTVLISVVAGKKINLLRSKLKKFSNFYRVMPNMPAVIGQSMNCVVTNNRYKKSIKEEVIKLFSFSGNTIFLKNEKQIDMATAVSGSGPGFVFNMIDAMEKAAIKLGFNKEVSRIMVSQTFRGSINLLLNNSLTAEDLVKTVATQGGTTEAGLKIMKKYNFEKVFIKVLKASYQRAKEQGK